MKRRILMSLLVIGAVTALVGFTVADFNDTETSVGNTVSTGSLNLKLGTTTGGPTNCVYTDPYVSSFFDIDNAKPGDSQEVTICVWNDGSIDGTLSGNVTNLDDVEVGDCNEPEALVDTTCGDGDAGELAQNVLVKIWVDVDCMNDFDTGEDILVFEDNMIQLELFGFPTGDMNADSSWCYGILATVHAGAGNEIQTDKVTADLTFTLIQD